jgi:hypothetical protein
VLHHLQAHCYACWSAQSQPAAAVAAAPDVALEQPALLLLLLLLPLARWRLLAGWLAPLQQLLLQQLLRVWG